MNQIINCIWNHPEAPIVYLACDMLGQEDILLQVSATFGSKDEFGIWHVCYSMHSSKEELESAMQLLSPKWVVSTLPSCRAMELNYVKKNCFISRFSPGDPFWKLLDIDMGVAAADDSHTATLMSEEHALDSASSKIEHVIESASVKKQLLSLSPAKKSSYNSVWESKAKFSGI